MKNRISRRVALILVAAAASISTSAFAVDPGVAGLWNSISFTDIIAAVFGIGALVIGVDLAQLGYQKVRRLVKGAH